MKKKLLAVAVVGALASPVAFAQTLYGIVDVGYQNIKYADGDFNKHFIQSGQHSGSRFGVRGSEDLAAGTYAMYQVEFNIVADTGGPGATDTTRLTFVGLGSKAWGEFTLGRQYTHTFHTFAVGSASGYGTFSSFYVAALGPGITTRASNSVKYSSPVMGGFSVGALWAPGESTTAGASSNGDYMDFALRYTPGPFGVAVSHAIATAEAAGTSNDTDMTQITANWDNRAWGIYGGYLMTDNDTNTVDRTAWWINPVVRFGGRHELYFLYGTGENDLVSGQESTTIAVTYQHVMSKRTRVYTSLGRVSNDNGAATGLNGQAAAGAAGYDPRGFQLGLLHSF
jgi:predicted porin